MNVAFIPVRGGSKSIPLKNIKPMCGKPLVYWTVEAACECPEIDVVYVSTDSKEIRQTVEQFIGDKVSFSKVRVISRSEESALDTASTEFVMLEFAEQYEFDHIVLVQATSPLLTSDDISHGFKIYKNDDTDSVLSVVRQKRFNWLIDSEGNAHSSNYDVFNRPRRQEFEGYLVENGAFYITSKERLLTTRNRVSGNIKVCEMDQDTFFEIDEPEDWIIIENLLKKKCLLSDRTKESKRIKMFLTDSDGCLTDGGMYYTENGDEIKKFCTLDGMGFDLLKKAGILCGIITGENRELVAKRAQKVKVDILEMGITDKLSVVKRLCQEYKVDLSEIAYMGDDINDLEVMKHVGLSFSVPNAMDYVKENADVVTSRCGGEGAVREAIDFILFKNKDMV